MTLLQNQNPTKIKDILEAQEYAQLMNTPCLNHEVKKAFVFSYILVSDAFIERC